MTIAMFVAVPILAVILAKTFDIPNVMRGAMVLLAISAAAPLLPGKLLKLGDDLTHDATLAAVTSVLAIVLVPLALKGLGVAFQRDIGITVAAVAAVLMTTFLLPLGIGMVARAVLGPARAVRIGDLAGDAGDIVLGILVLLIVVAQRATVFPLLWQSAIVIALFAAGALAIGHLLGGPDPRERTSLAIATVTRHPGLALLMGVRELSHGAGDAPGGRRLCDRHDAGDGSLYHLAQAGSVSGAICGIRCASERALAVYAWPRQAVG